MKHLTLLSLALVLTTACSGAASRSQRHVATASPTKLDVDHPSGSPNAIGNYLALPDRTEERARNEGHDEQHSSEVPPSPFAEERTEAAEPAPESAPLATNVLVPPATVEASRSSERGDEGVALSPPPPPTAPQATPIRDASEPAADASGLRPATTEPRPATPETARAQTPPPEAPWDAPPEPPQPSRPQSDRTTAEVFQAVSNLRGLSGWTIIPLAHFRRGEREVMVVWPALDSSGRLVDATVVGVCLEPSSSGELVECGRRWVVRDPGHASEDLARALGGRDYEVVSSPRGTPLTQLGPQLARFGSDFAAAVSRGDLAAARRAGAAFVAMLPVERVAFDNQVATLLFLAARYNGRLQHVETRQRGNEARLVFRARRGFMTMRTIEATARPLDGSPDLWVLADYR